MAGPAGRADQGRADQGRADQGRADQGWADQGLSGFAAVGLEELIGEAALLTRADRTYLVPLSRAAAVLGGLDPRSRVLDIGGRREFEYDSLYFDTPDRLLHRLAAHRRRHRLTVRTRAYLDTGSVFLEMKTMGGRGETRKQRMPWDPRGHGRLDQAGRAFLAGLLRDAGHDPRIAAELRPCLASRYRRATVLLPEGGRLTIDARLTWAAPAGGRIALPGYVVIESKSAGPAGAVDRMLWRRGLRPVSFGKFGVGSAALDPALPRNRWARLLRGPLDDPPRPPGDPDRADAPPLPRPDAGGTR